ncbi:MAG: hypothetical protein LC122_02395 [Chitinophagales bacterium]|nr:hypothetical protein [Chitinophagales bacterium]
MKSFKLAGVKFIKDDEGFFIPQENIYYAFNYYDTIRLEKIDYCVYNINQLHFYSDKKMEYIESKAIIIFSKYQYYIEDKLKKIEDLE